jgi:hypothetical protein
MKNIIFIIIIFIITSQISSASSYRVFVDKEFGFFGVQSNSTDIINYTNSTLHINIGDTIEWENFVATDERVTIVSDNRLWNETDAILGWNYKIFSYNFNKKGTYRVHLKENSIYRLPEDYNWSKANEERTNKTLSEWFEYQVRVPLRYQIIVVGDNTTSPEIKHKNKIIAKSGSNYTRTFEDEIYEESIVPITTKIKENTSKYRKYTLLELLKFLFTK